MGYSVQVVDAIYLIVSLVRNILATDLSLEQSKNERRQY